MSDNWTKSDPYGPVKKAKRPANRYLREVDEEIEGASEDLPLLWDADTESQDLQEP